MLLVGLTDTGADAPDVMVVLSLEWDLVEDCDDVVEVETEAEADAFVDALMDYA